MVRRSNWLESRPANSISWLLASVEGGASDQTVSSAFRPDRAYGATLSGRSQIVRCRSVSGVADALVSAFEPYVGRLTVVCKWNDALCSLTRSKGERDADVDPIAEHSTLLGDSQWSVIATL
jgi:hypothetical protein